MTEVLLVTAILRPVILKLTTKKYLDCHQKYFKLHNNVWHDSRCPYDISSQDTQLVDTVCEGQNLKYSQPIIIMATAKIFSPSVVGAMFPNPTLVRLVIVKYNEEM